MSLHLYGNSIYKIMNPTNMIKSFAVLSVITIAFAVAFFFQNSLFSSSKIQAQESSQQESIRVCCAWGDKVSDGILTYKIVGSGGRSSSSSSNTGSAEYKQAVYNSINEWNSKLHGIKLVEVSSDNADRKKNNNNDDTPDLQIKLSSKTPRMRVGEIISGDISSVAKTRLSTQGVSYIKRDSNGFITNILITIFTSDPFGNTLLSSSSFDPGKIETITKHEIGHALGIGHSNLISDLMYPVINSRTNTDISDCDIHAVSEANSWKFESNDNNGDPQPPSVGRVHC
jgi:Matrixin